MGRRPRSTAAPAAFTVTAGEPGADPIIASDPDDQTVDQLASGAEEGQKVPRARVTRWNDEMRVYAVLDHVPATNIDESWIRDEYGGGKYIVYFYGQRNDGTFGYLKGKQKELIIDSSIPFRGAVGGRKPITGAIHDGPAPQGSTLMDMGMLQLFKTMQDNSTLMMQQARDHSAAQTAMLERLAAPRDNGLMTVLPLVMPLITALVTGQQQKKDPIDAAREIAALMKGNDSGGGVREAMGVMRDMMEMRELMGTGNGDGDGEAGWMRILEKVVPGAIEILKTEAAKRGQPLVQVARQPAPARLPATTARPTDDSPVSTSPSTAPVSSAAPPSTSPAPESSPVADEWSGLEGHVATLARMAAQNSEPYGVMQTIKTLAPGSMLAAVRELVVREDATDVLLTRFPVLQPHRAWVDQLLDEFHVEFFGEDEELDVPPGVEPPLPPDIHGETTPLDEE